MKYPHVALGTLLSVLTACSTTPTPRGVSDDEIEAQFAERAKKRKAYDAILNERQRVLLDLDKALDKFYESVHQGADHRVVSRREALEKVIRDKTRRHFDSLVATADNPTHVGNRGIALAALGFADGLTGPEGARKKSDRDYVETALNSLVTALNDPDSHIVNQAVHGIGMLRAPNTPTKAIASILEDSKESQGIRRAAAWTLMSVQPYLAGDRRKALRPIWLRLLSQPVGELEPEISVQALRGLGLFRLAEDARSVEPYCDHPMALVRIHACVALGRQKNQNSHKKLFQLLQPSESNRNVRLAARKALKALAGGTDRGYDLKKWEKLFQRG
ncbi:MAG: hypothetical protein VX951_11050 [Planctomycetota bacterium]|nr:hypothetical protein [Planctomycetota bacterium]